MRVLVTVLYVVAFALFLVGVWMVLRQVRDDRQTIARALAKARGADMALGAVYQMEDPLGAWSNDAALALIDHLEAGRKSEMRGTWIALAGGVVGFAATVLSVWNL